MNFWVSQNRYFIQSKIFRLCFVIIYQQCNYVICEHIVSYNMARALNSRKDCHDPIDFGKLNLAGFIEVGM